MGELALLLANGFLAVNPTLLNHCDQAVLHLRGSVWMATSVMICNPSRTAALDQLSQFIAIAGLYELDRNYVKPGHPSVSRLSPAIRHRLITEQEVMSAVLRIHPIGRVEKYIQEVYWRRYWKSWLARVLKFGVISVSWPTCRKCCGPARRELTVREYRHRPFRG